MFKPISISLSPNTESDDIWLAFKLLFQPWRWKGSSLKLEEKFKEYLGVKYVFAFNSGRSSLMAILNSLDLPDQKNEVLLQAFTCNAVPNPVMWSGLKPVYVDCGDDFNMNAKDLEKKAWSRSAALIIQHTFGQPADMDKILEICRRKGLVLIEDCAHALGSEYKGKKVGTFGKAAFFSFSRDKAISSVYGGMAVTDDEELAKKIKEYREKIPYPSYFWTKQQLLHPILLNWLVLPFYSILGKYFLILLQWFHILSKAVHWKEKRGLKPGYFPKKMSNVLAILALNQFEKLGKFNQHRQKIANFYLQELSNTRYQMLYTACEKGNISLRFAVKHENARQIIKQAWKKNILIGDWYTSPIAPADTNLDKMHYELGSCPVAEKLTKETLNLPTHINISLKEARKIVDFLNQWK